MKLKIFHIEPDGTAMVKFDEHTAKKIKQGQTLIFNKESGTSENPFIVAEAFELDTSRIACCSSRIRSAVLVYFYYINMRKNKALSPFQSAVKKVAEESGISVPSVYDKLTRQINCNASEFQDILAEAYNGNISGLQTKLIHHAVNKFDEDVIENYLPEINKVYK